MLGDVTATARATRSCLAHTDSLPVRSPPQIAHLTALSQHVAVGGILTRGWIRRGAPAGISTGLGAAAAVLTNVLTNGWSWPVGVGLAVLLVVWIGWAMKQEASKTEQWEGIAAWIEQRSRLLDHPQPRPRQQRIMLQRVRHKWIDGALSPSLAHSKYLNLRLASYQHAPMPPRKSSETEGGAERAVTALRNVFDRVSSGLLVLGAAGGGKTTLVLELARDLLDEAENDPTFPVPVVLNLVTWAQRRQPLADWLVQEINVGYKIPARIARAWVEADELILLLDGLDEVPERHRKDCAIAIAEFRRQHGIVPIVVCSRNLEGHILSSSLELEQVVEVLPPTTSEIEAVLEYVESTGPRLTALRTAFATEPDLRDFLGSPLMLHVISVAYRDRTEDILRDNENSERMKARLFESFVARMFVQRPLPSGCGYSEKNARAWLSWLAQSLRHRYQHEFYLDRLTPDWLPVLSQRLAVAFPAVAGGITFATFGQVVNALAGPVVSWGLFSFASIALLISIIADPYYPARREFWLSFVVGFLSLLGPVDGLVSIAVSGAMGIVLTELVRTSSKPAEELKWSLAAVLPKGPNRTLIATMVVVIIGIPIGNMLLGSPDDQRGELGFTLLFVSLTALLRGLTGTVRTQRTRPNEGIYRSARNALLIGVSIAFVAGVANLSLSLLERRTSEAAGLTSIGGMAGAPITGAIAAALVYGLIFGMVYGGASVLQHYVVRVLLIRNRAAPWHYMEFADAMTERLLLVRLGSSYQFSHRLLQDHFAAYPEVAPHK